MDSRLVWGREVALSDNLSGFLKDKIRRFGQGAIKNHKGIVARALKNGRTPDACLAEMELMAMERMVDEKGGIF